MKLKATYIKKYKYYGNNIYYKEELCKNLIYSVYR